jgi:hypothetical protein
MALQTEGVELGAADLPALSDHLGADTLVESDVVVAAHDLGPKGLARTGATGPQRNARHAFDATGNGNIIGAGDYALSREVRGLLTGAALAIHRRTGNGFRETGGKHGIAGNVESLFTGLSNTSRDDIVDEGRIEPVPLDDCFKSVAEQVYGMPPL